MLWIIQILLAAFFIMAGLGKIRNSKEQHIADGHIKPEASIIPIRILGILELFGCIGIIVPWLAVIIPILTPITAVCFCFIMIGAFVVHFQKKEYKFLLLPVFVIVLSSVVAYYRFAATI